MAPRRLNYTIEPMTLANMRENGVRSLAVSCWCRPLGRAVPVGRARHALIKNIRGS
jgi:hypothetical protein